MNDNSTGTPDSTDMRTAQFNLGLCQMLIKLSVHVMTHALGQWQLHAVCWAPVTTSILLALKSSSGHCSGPVLFELFFPFTH